MGGQYVQEKWARFPDALYRGRCAGDSGIARRLNLFSMPGYTMIIGIPITSSSMPRTLTCLVDLVAGRPRTLMQSPVSEMAEGPLPCRNWENRWQS